MVILTNCIFIFNVNAEFVNRDYHEKMN
jgi:hypothetical protein